MPAGVQGEQSLAIGWLPHKYVPAATPTPASEGAWPQPQLLGALLGFHRVVFCVPFAEPASWWERPKPTPASQTSWRGEPSTTVRGPPGGLRRASRFRSTTPVSDTCPSSKNQSRPSVTSPFSSCSFGLSDGSVLWAAQVPREISFF